MISLLKQIIYPIVALFIFFFVLGNISLMKNGKNDKVKTNHSIGSLPPYTPSEDDQDKIMENIESYGKKLIKNSSKDCLSAKKQIMKHVTFKHPPGTRTDGLMPGMTKELALVDDDKPIAPVLENFDDYAPEGIPMDKGTVHLAKTKQNVPKALNEHDEHHLSKFESEYRTPWNGQKGKDDLSYFFDTHNFDTSFDNFNKKPVVCPVEWEKLSSTSVMLRNTSVKKV